MHANSSVKEAAKKVLAYQQTPIIILTSISRGVPDELLDSLTDEEREYIMTRAENPFEQLFYELLPQIGAAGVLSTISPVIMDLHASKPKLRTDIDGISIPLAEEEATQDYLLKEYYQPYIEAVKGLVHKTTQRFGQAHVVQVCVLPQFHMGALVKPEIATYGNPCLDDAVHNPTDLRDLYEVSGIRYFPNHTWIGVNRKLFTTPGLRKELLERLSRIKTELLAKR